MTHNSIVYRADWSIIDPLHKPIRPLRVLFLTSIRDTGTCDRNGLEVETPEGLVYMEGVIERCVNESCPGGLLHGLIEVAGVITDDISDTRETADYPVAPLRDNPWIHPLGLRNHDSRLVTEITFNQPSSFRRLKLSETEKRTSLKKRFEWLVMEAMWELQADVLISDHYMARVEYLVANLGLFGRVLNIHPAITLPGQPYAFPGKTPTADAIARANSCPNVFTGATLHLMDTIIDHGPVIAYQCSTPVYATDEPQHLRARNYVTKCRVFVHGMIHYVRNVYPYLDRLDPSKFTNRAWIGGK